MSVYNDIFASTDYEESFAKNRSLPQKAIDEWCRRIQAAAVQSKCPNIADLGCGLGRFTMPLAKIVTHGKILAVDNSETMLRELKYRINNECAINIFPMQADICCYNSDFNIGVFFLSEVMHCVDSVMAIFSRSLKFATRHCCFIIRIPSHAQLTEIEWLRWFPGALELDIKRTPSIDEIMHAAKMAGFRCNSRVTSISETKTLDRIDFLTPLISRSYSILRLISDIDFKRGLRIAAESVSGVDQVETKHNMTCVEMWR